MPIVVSITSGEKRDYEAVSEGLHQAVVADVIDEGVKETQWGPKQRYKVVFMTDEADSNGFTKMVSTFLKVKPPENGKPVRFHEKSNAYKELVKILGGVPKDGFDLESLIGIRRGLVIQHNEDKEGTVWANIVGYMKPQNNNVAIPESYTRKKDRPQQSGNFNNSQVRAAGGGKAAAAAVLSRPPQPQPISDEDIPF